MDWRERLAEGLSLFDVHLFDLAGTPITLATLILFAIMILFTLAVAKLLQRMLARIFAARGFKDEGTVAVFSRLVRYLVLVVGLGAAVHTLGINLTALFAAGAVFAVAIGFAMQNIAQNFVSGVILLLERAIKPGDVLEVEGRLVRVRDMGVRATIARTLDEEDIIIPNSLLVTSTVKNYTFREATYRLRTVVGVTYDSDMAKVRRILEKTAEEIPWRLPSEPRILMTEFADSAVNFDVSVWIDTPWQMRQRKSQLNEAIWWAFQEAGIVIAFPQLDVHFEPRVTRSLEGLRAVGEGAARRPAGTG